MLREFRDSFMNRARAADRWVAGEAAKRGAAAMQAGVDRNRAYVMGQSPETVGSRLASELGGKDDSWRKQMIGALGSQSGRQMAADQYAAGMNRGPMQIGQQGLAEAVNMGIANNRYVRRGLLPAAIGGGGLMAGAAVTAGAQNLMALMDFMSAGREQEQRVEQSPLA
jgi:hypothetical protein